jgi:anhydro-N-acetylmuramic acid kinase
VTNQTLTAIGLMSGTSMDGIDAAVLRTDGDRVEGFGPSTFIPYETEFRERLRSVLGSDPIGNKEIPSLTEELTDHHIKVVQRLIFDNDVDPTTIDVIGFHGHTVFHNPKKGITSQIGNGARLARETGISVVCDFRSNDVAHGGQGAPLAPVFHAALSWNYEKPLAVLNIGGVANVTWISPDGGLIAFDTGPGNALIDDWVRFHKMGKMDIGGELAHSGKINEKSLKKLLDNPFFLEPFPKSLDRDEFDPSPVAHLSVEDGAATLTAFSANAVEKAAHLFPSPPNRWLVCGGGRLNKAFMSAMRGLLMQPVEPVEMAGWHGDALEAQAFGYLAVRSLMGLPLSMPSTTGVSKPVSGGVLHQP